MAQNTPRGTVAWLARTVDALSNDPDPPESNAELCGDLVSAVAHAVRLAKTLFPSEDESKGGSEDAHKREPARDEPGEGNAGLSQLEGAVGEAVQLINEHRPQQTALDAFTTIMNSQQLLGRFYTVHERLQGACQALGRAEPRLPDLSSHLNILLRKDLHTLESRLGAQERVLLVTHRQQQEILENVRAIRAQMLRRPSDLQRRPVLTRRMLSATLNDCLQRHEARLAMQRVQQALASLPLPQPLDERAFVGSNDLLPGSIDVMRGTYMGEPVLYKLFSGVLATDEEAQKELRVHFRAQTLCGACVVNLRAATRSRMMKIVLGHADFALHHLLEQQRNLWLRLGAHRTPDEHARAAEALPATQLRLLKLVLHAVKGTAELHARGVFHRGLSPHSLLVRTVDGKDSALLSDFGFARSGRGNKGTLSMSARRAATRDGFEAIETLKYMAPEVITGHAGESRQSFVAADVYSLGVVLNTVLAGVEPFPDVHESRPMCTLARRTTGPQLFDVVRASEQLKDAAGESQVSVAHELHRLVACCFEQPHRRISPATLSRGMEKCILELETGEPRRQVPPTPLAQASPEARLLATLRRELPGNNAELLRQMAAHAQGLISCIEDLSQNPVGEVLGTAGLAAKVCLQLLEHRVS